ncbi:MAG TPA: glycosyl hydrolase family 18 protein [Chloroflexota bacterium]
MFLPLPALAMLAGLAVYLHIRYPTALPWTSAGYIVQNAAQAHARLDRQVVGFLPYWRLDDSRYIRHDLLSEVVFFALAADENGQIDKQDPGWRWWTSSVVRNQVAHSQIDGDSFALAIAMQKQQQIQDFLRSNQAQQTLIANMLDQVSANKLDSLNLDFEVDGKVGDDERQAFTAFATALTGAFHQQAPGKELSIDLPPLAARQSGLYDVAALAPLFDRVVVMSYDYYASSSDVAGPIAPMSGFDQGQYFFDVSTTYADFARLVPKDKLVMGVPYYGYDWPVQDDSKPLAPTLPQNDANGYPEILSYSRMKTDSDLKDCRWDDTAQETWCGYTDPKTNIQREVWLEDQRSIAVKYDFARSQALGGVAIWTLGYDGAYPELWDLLRAKFT